jgi:hypothetical protein
MKQKEKEKFFGEHKIQVILPSFRNINHDPHFDIIQQYAQFTKAAKQEQRYRWLEDIQDAQGRRPTDPDYDCSTLTIHHNDFQVGNFLECSQIIFVSIFSI